MSTFVTAPTRDLPHIGWDPCPGSPVDTRAVAALIEEFATKTSEMSEFVTGSGDGLGVWSGASSESFREAMADFPPKLTEVSQAFETASSALLSWADDLDGFQDRSWELDRRLAEKQDALSAAQGEIDGWLERGDDPDDVNANVEVRDAAKSEVRGVEGEIETLHDEYLEQARYYGGLLDDAGDAAWGGSWWDAVKDTWDDFTYWVENSFVGDIARTLAPLADWISEWGGWVSAITLAAAGVALAIPGAQVAVPVLLSISAVTGAASTAGDVTLATSGYGSWAPVGLGAVTLGIGAGASKATGKVIDSYRRTGRADQLVTARGPRGTQHTYVPSLFNMKDMQGNEALWNIVRIKGSQAEWAIEGYGVATELKLEKGTDPWDLPRGAARMEVPQ